MTLMFGSGITIEGGIYFGSGGSAPVGTGVITYDEMPPPVTVGVTLQDTTATINSPTGFTINNVGATGVAIRALSAENLAYFTTYGTGTHTVNWGVGSSYASSTVNIVSFDSNPPPGQPQLIFFIDTGLTYPATFNYPFTFI